MYPPTQPNVQMQQLPRQWHKCFCFWCGDCDAQGWGACCLSTFLPFISIGWNRQRAFAKHGILWGLAAFTVWLAYIIVSQVAQEEECDVDDDGEIDCWNKTTLLGHVLLAIFALGMFFIGYVNRMQIRNRFALPGDAGTDFLLWLCCSSCALCQETRTMMYNQVENGVWQGPHGMVQLVVTGQPANQGAPPYPPAPPAQNAFQAPPAQVPFDSSPPEDERKTSL